MRSLEALLSRKRIRHLEKSRDRARRRVQRLQSFIKGSADIVSLRDCMATSLFKEIDREMGKALYEIVKNDCVKENVLETAHASLRTVVNGNYVYAMTKLCKILPTLTGRRKRCVRALIKEAKNDALLTRYGKAPIGTQQLAAAFEAFHFLKGARNESAHLFERAMKKSYLPSRRQTQRVFLKDLQRALQKRDVSDRLKDMIPLLQLEVDQRLASM